MDSDPTVPGAETHAPPALEARSTQDSVRFVLLGPWGDRGQQSRAWIRVDRRGVEITFLGRSAVVPWEDVDACEVLVSLSETRGPVLALLDTQGAVLAAAPCVGTPDDAWLAAYLQAQIERRRMSPRERARFEQDAAELQALLGSIDGGRPTE